MKELLKKKSIIIALLFIMVAVIVVIAGMNVRSARKEKEYNTHIEAAEKYLTELDYEQAIAEYTLALEIEPNAEEVLNGLEKTYLAYADALADSGEYEKAIQILNEGYAQTGRESLQEKLTQIQEMQAQAEEEERLEAEREEILKPYMQQVYELMAAEDYEKVWDIFGEITKIENIDILLQKGDYLYFPEENETQTGIGAGIYLVRDWYGIYSPVEISEDDKNNIAFYYGNYIEGKREGKGVSVIRYCASVFNGEWENDAPNGYGELEMDTNGGVNGKVLNFTICGNLVDGLWDGSVSFKRDWEDENGDTHTWNDTFQATNGIPEDKTEAYIADWERHFENSSDIRDWLKNGFVYAYLKEERGMRQQVIGNGQTMGIWGFANILF